MNDLEPVTAVEETLRDNGVSVESVSLDDAVSLTYPTTSPDVEPDHDKAGRAVTSFLERARDDGLRSRTVKVTISRSGGDVQVTWTFKADWIHMHNDCAFDDEELSRRILDGLYEEGDA